MLLQIRRSADVYDKIPRMKVANAKYLTIAEELRREILAGKYASGQRFPSEEMLVRRFRVSRPTVERALRELKREHLLESRAGSGSYLTFTAINAMGSLGIIAPDYRKIDFFTDLCDQSTPILDGLINTVKADIIHAQQNEHLVDTASSQGVPR